MDNPAYCVKFPDPGPPKKRGPKTKPIEQRLAAMLRVDGYEIDTDELCVALATFPRPSIPEMKCWIWTGATTGRQADFGARKPVTSREGRTLSVARLMFEIINGGPFPEIWYARRECPSPLCVSPYHYALAVKNTNRAPKGREFGLCTTLVAWERRGGMGGAERAAAPTTDGPSQAPRDQRVADCFELIEEYIVNQERPFSDFLDEHLESEGADIVRAAIDLMIEKFPYRGDKLQTTLC